MRSERNITTEIIDQIESSSVQLVFFAEFNFLNTTVRLSTANGPLEWNGNQWLGIGDFGGISSLNETSSLEAKGIEFILDGIPSDIISTVFNEEYRNRVANLWIAFLDNSRNVIDDPIGPFGYLMDYMEINEGVETSTITIRAENKLKIMKQASNRRSDNQDQQIEYPDDMGYQFVASIQNKVIQW